MLRNTAIAVGSILFLAGALLVGLEDLFKRSEAYQLGVSRFGESAAAAAELGAPLRVGWLVKGSINVRNERGVAQLAIPVSGAARSGTLFEMATKRNGAWKIESLILEVDGKRTDLSER